MSSEFFHHDSDSVRFWVEIDDALVGASVSRATLHHRYAPQSVGEEPIATFRANASKLEAAVRSRVSRGSIEPVMLRESDLRV